MTKKLYLDGCSFTFGEGLDPEERLGQLFEVTGGYLVNNLSRSGKSNLAIAMDIFKHSQDADIIVVGWSFADRFYLKVNEFDVDFLPGRTEIGLPTNLGSNLVATAYQDFHKYFYTLYQDPFMDDFSDMLINTVYQWCLAQGKKIVFFSWENRNSNFKIYRHYAPPAHKQADGHLNTVGMQHLFQNLQQLIYEQQG